MPKRSNFNQNNSNGSQFKPYNPPYKRTSMPSKEFDQSDSDMEVTCEPTSMVSETPAINNFENIAFFENSNLIDESSSNTEMSLNVNENNYCDPERFNCTAF
jgi:hypothetical protein